VGVRDPLRPPYDHRVAFFNYSNRLNRHRGEQVSFAFDAKRELLRCGIFKGESAMTLCVGIETSGGIVLASDSRATIGDLRGLTTNNDTAVKIFTPVPNMAVALSGDGGTGHSLMQHITAGLAPQVITDIDALAQGMQTLGRQWYVQSFGAPSWMMTPAGMPVTTPRPDTWYLLAGYTMSGQPKLVTMTSAVPFNFTPGFINTGFAAIGVAPLAMYLLNRFYRRDLSLEIAKDLAAYCIEETASQDGKVGGPLRMAIAYPNGPTEMVCEEEIVILGKRVCAHREALMNSFLSLPRESQVAAAPEALAEAKLAPAE
jgi:20S proteasome alpha/beta subunit